MRIRYALCGRDFIRETLATLGTENLAWTAYPCLAWKRGVDKDGYGQFKMPGDRLQTKAHRYAWKVANGSIPDDLWVLHHCDNPRCFRPSHLFLGTHKDNMKDMALKGRAGCPATKHPELMPRGEAHGNAKLTEEKVRTIRSLYAAGSITTSEIGMRFSVSQSLIAQVVARKIWRHVA